MNVDPLIALIVERDGQDAANKFAEQALTAYVRMAINESKYKDAINWLTRYLEALGYRIKTITLENPE